MTKYLEMKYVSKHRNFVVNVLDDSSAHKELTRLYIQTKFIGVKQTTPTLLNAKLEKYKNVKCGTCFHLNIETLASLKGYEGIISIAKIEGIENDLELKHFESLEDLYEDFQGKIYQTFEVKEKFDTFIEVNAIRTKNNGRDFLKITADPVENKINNISSTDNVILHLGQPLSFNRVVNDLEQKRLISYFSERNVNKNWKLKSSNDGWFIEVKRTSKDEWNTKIIGSFNSKFRTNPVINRSHDITNSDVKMLDKTIEGLNKKDFVITSLANGALAVSVRRSKQKLKNEKWDFKLKNGIFNFEILADYFIEKEYDVKFSETTKSLYFQYKNRIVRFSDHLPHNIQNKDFVEIRDGEIIEIYTILKEEIISSRLIMNIIERISE